LQIITEQGEQKEPENRRLPPHKKTVRFTSKSHKNQQKSPIFRPEKSLGIAGAKGASERQQ